jgi:Na+/proline symporter
MLPSIFVQIRDFVYLWLTKSYNEEYAKKECNFRIGVFWLLYYVAMIVFFTFIVVSFSPPIHFTDSEKHFLKTNFIVRLIGGSILLLPYYIWLKKILFPQLDMIPIDLSCDEKCYKKKRTTTILTFIGGFLLIILIGFINNLIRNQYE